METGLGENTFSRIVLITLFLLSGLHGGWGKNLPKPIWIISLTSSMAIGAYIGFSIAPFPDDILIAVVLGSLLVGLNLFSRLARKNHDV
jgi:hypothetical protein